MTDRNDQASDDLDLYAAAGTYDIPEGDVGAVIGRARRNAARRRTAGALVGVVAVIAAVVSVQAIGEDDDGQREVPLAADNGLVRGDAGVQWRTTTPDAGLGMAYGHDEIVGAGPLYALSTAAGQRMSADGIRRNRVLWRSADGVDWAAVSSIANDLYLSDLAERDGRIYAVGTTAASRAQLVAGWSDDAGKTFDRTPLPLDLTGYDAQTTRIDIGGASVDAGPAGTLVVVTVGASLDVPALLPDGVDAPNGWAVTATGVDLLGDERNGCPEHKGGEFEKLETAGEPREMPAFRCAGAGDRDETVLKPAQEIFGVIGSYTFDELGIDDFLRSVVLRQPVAFHAPPGSTAFTEVDLPETPPLFGIPVVDAHDGGFDVVASSTSLDQATAGVVGLHSADGRTFAPSSSIPDLEWVTAVGQVRGVTTIVGGTMRGAVLAQADGSGGWRTSSLASAVDPEALGDRLVNAYVAGIGDFGIVVSAVLIDENRETGFAESRVLVSRDGNRWSDTRLADLVTDDKIRGITRIVVSPERAVVTVAVGDMPADGGPSPQVALVGVAS